MTSRPTLNFKLVNSNTVLLFSKDRTRVVETQRLAKNEAELVCLHVLNVLRGLNPQCVRFCIIYTNRGFGEHNFSFEDMEFEVLVPSVLFQSSPDRHFP